MKRGESPRIKTGLAYLRELGIAYETTPLHELEQAAGSEPDVAIALASLLAGHPNEESLSALRRLEVTAGKDKELRREIRRSLYRLEQRGITSAEQKAPITDLQRPILTTNEPQGYFSAADPQGDRLFWITKPRAGGGLSHLSAIVNEPNGLKQAVLANVARKSLRKLRADILQQHGVRLVECDWRYCDWIASEGYIRARDKNQVRDAASKWPQLRMQVLTQATEKVPPPIEKVLGPATDPKPEDLATSADILADPDFAHWLLPIPIIQPWLDRFAEVSSSTIVLDRSSEADRIEDLVQDAMKTLFSGDAATSWKRRLEEIAWILWKTDRAELARKAFAAALAIEQSESGGVGIPFFEALTRRTFLLLFRAKVEKEQEESKSSLIVTPRQLREQQAHAARLRGARER